MIGDIPPLLLPLGWTIAAGAILHAVEDIEQAHVSLLMPRPRCNMGAL